MSCSERFYSPGIRPSGPAYSSSSISLIESSISMTKELSCRYWKKKMRLFEMLWEMVSIQSFNNRLEFQQPKRTNRNKESGTKQRRYK